MGKKKRFRNTFSVEALSEEQLRSEKLKFGKTEGKVVNKIVNSDTKASPGRADGRKSSNLPSNTEDLV